MTYSLLEAQREVRDQIWTYVLASPTGFITLEEAQPIERKTTLSIFPYDSLKKIPLREHRIKSSIPRVCKRLHADSKHLLWKCNALRVEQACDLNFFMSWDSLATELKQHVRHIDMEILDRRHRIHSSFDTFNAGQQLADWPRVGSLRTLTLTSSIRMFNSLFHESLPHQKYVTLLYNTACVDGNGPTPTLEKKIIPGTGLSAMDLEEKIGWLRANLPEKPSAIAKELHGAFDGDIWINGVLCCKYGVEIENVFKLSAEDDTDVVFWSF